MKKVVLTGDRPTGPLHIGHYVGSLKTRVEMQNSGLYEMFVMIADIQALTDNADNAEKIQNNLMEVMLDYLAVGLEIGKTRFFIQSQIPALFELPMYYSNLVTMARLERNPTIKSEIKMRGFNKSIPVGFMTYPISQAADITALGANLVPVGADQLPMIEQAREIVSSFNKTYKTNVLIMPEAVLPDNKNSYRIVGLDGNAKMSKSLGNCIFIKDEPQVIKKKVMSMYTDPDHINIQDPGKIKGNAVFTYLDIFCKDEHFQKYLPEYKNLKELKEHYQKGGLGDVKVKLFLNDILQGLLEPMRIRRNEYEKRKPELLEVLKTDTAYVVEYSNKILNKVREAMGVNYFTSTNFHKRLK
jgi:tryptophanyl-tRNA synthetase